jgi:hypothetical protein
VIYVFIRKSQRTKKTFKGKLSVFIMQYYSVFSQLLLFLFSLCVHTIFFFWHYSRTSLKQKTKTSWISYLLVPLNFLCMRMVLAIVISCFVYLGSFCFLFSFSFKGKPFISIICPRAVISLLLKKVRMII